MVCYNMEYSRDGEPMKGGFTDNYYFQMIDGIRRFKGVRKPEPPTEPATIAIDGEFDDWQDVGPDYRDHIDDCIPRHAWGYAKANLYTNYTGRNNFIRMKVTYDKDNVYFYAETEKDITPFKGDNWMLLFIDADQNHATGWEGYDYLANKFVNDDKTTTLKLAKTGWDFRTINRQVAYHVKGNKLELSIPRVDIGQTNPDHVAFDFHWADNIQKDGDIIEFAVSGDSAPERRFNYRFDARR